MTTMSPTVKDVMTAQAGRAEEAAPSAALAGAGYHAALARFLDGHPVLAGLAPHHLDLFARFCWAVDFPDGTFLFREGRPAEKFFLILDGRVVLETGVPGAAISVQTLRDGDVAGFSWLLEPHRWKFDGRADGTVRAIGVDGARLREACERDPRLGYELTRRFAKVAVQRLEAARSQSALRATGAKVPRGRAERSGASRARRGYRRG